MSTIVLFVKEGESARAKEAEVIEMQRATIAHSLFGESLKSGVGVRGTHWAIGPKGIAYQAGFSAADARMSLLEATKGRRWNLLKASFNVFLFNFSFISVTQTPISPILFQLI